MSSVKKIPDLPIPEQLINDELYMEQRQKESEKFYQESIQRAVEEKKRDNEFRENIATIAKTLDDFVDVKTGKSDKELAVEVALKCIEIYYHSNNTVTMPNLIKEINEIIEVAYNKLENLGRTNELSLNEKNMEEEG